MQILMDVGGTNMRIGFSLDGKSLSDSVKLPTPQEFEQAMQIIEQNIAGLSNGAAIQAVAAGFAAPISRDGESLYNPPNLPRWSGQPLKKRLAQMLNCPVHIVNDAALAGLGEANNPQGAGFGHKVVGFVAIGTGIGGARIVNGKIDANSFGFEPGHHIINFDAQPNHWEAMAAGKGILQTYGKHAGELNSAGAEWQNVNRAIAVGLYNMCLFWSPDIIVVGGGLGISENVQLEQVIAQLTLINQQSQRIEQLPKVVKAALGDSAGLYGGIEFLCTSAPDLTTIKMA